MSPLKHWQDDGASRSDFDVHRAERGGTMGRNQLNSKLVDLSDFCDLFPQNVVFYMVLIMIFLCKTPKDSSFVVLKRKLMPHQC